MPSVETWLDLETAKLSEISQTERDKYHNINYTWSLKDTDELICKAESYRSHQAGLSRTLWGKGLFQASLLSWHTAVFSLCLFI